jgi:hypothetical protein
MNFWRKIVNRNVLTTGAILLVVVLVAFFMLYGLRPASATDYSGTAITICNPDGGGIKVFDSDNFGGGDRVWCNWGRNNTNVDNDFGASGGNSLFSIGNFDNVINAVRVRAVPGCNVVVRLYYGYDLSGDFVIVSAAAQNSSDPVVNSFDVPNNVISSGKMTTVCP